MLLFVGLGNPGAEYTENRHNAGFMVADAIARHHDFPAPRQRFHGHVAEGRIAEAKVLLFKPGTYMNESGLAIGEVSRYFKIPPGEIVVFHDEIDLAPGKVRVKKGGGNAGHNGLRSIDAHIGPDFWRVRIGVGHPGSKEAGQAYVLRNFPKADRAWLDPLIEAIAEAAPLLTEFDGAGFMNKVTLATRPPEEKTPPDQGADHGL